MDPHDLLHRYAEQPKGIIVPQILFRGIGNIPDVRQGFDAFGRHTCGGQTLMVKFHVPVAVIHQRTQAFQLEPFQLGAAHTFPFRVPDALSHALHPVL